jgi:hypothetical protein
MLLGGYIEGSIGVVPRPRTGYSFSQTSVVHKTSMLLHTILMQILSEAENPTQPEPALPDWPIIFETL